MTLPCPRHRSVSCLQASKYVSVCMQCIQQFRWMLQLYSMAWLPFPSPPCLRLRYRTCTMPALWRERHSTFQLHAFQSKRKQAVSSGRKWHHERGSSFYPKNSQQESRLCVFGTKVHLVWRNHGETSPAFLCYLFMFIQVTLYSLLVAFSQYSAVS